MRFDLHEMADRLGGRLAGSEPPAEGVNGLAIDSRTVSAGQLFAALEGGRDGHDFVAAARGAGAAAALVSRVVDDAPSLVVPDVATALRALAGWARTRLPDPVVGITGSVGKTTTKDLLAAALGTTFRTTASQRSFNNELGVPLTLANAPDDTEVTVVEMGARGPGHIALLCDMARPTVGVVTAVHAVHTEVMGDLDDIAAAKAELVEALPADGLAVLNADDPRVSAMGDRGPAPVLFFGRSPAADVRAGPVEVDEDLRARFTLESPWGGTEVHLGARGAHNVHNALAAASVALWAGVEPAAVGEGLARPPESPLRMQLHRCRGGRLVLDDSYNAGPASMEAALLALAELPARRRVAVLATMAELGSREGDEHSRVASLAAELGVSVVSVGTDLYGSQGNAPVELSVPATGDGAGRTDAQRVVREMDSAGMLESGCAVLVKGSRVAGLDAVSESLVEFLGHEPEGG